MIEPGWSKLFRVVIFVNAVPHHTYETRGAVWELQLVPNRVLQPHYVAGKTPPAGKSENLTTTTKHSQITWNDPKWTPHGQPDPFGIIARDLGGGQ